MIKILDDLVEKWEGDLPTGQYASMDCTEWDRAHAACALELRAAIPVVDAELLRWKKAVESLTPSGSEYVDDPEACAEFIQWRWNIAHEIALENVKRRQAIEAQQKELVEAAKEIGFQLAKHILQQAAYERGVENAYNFFDEYAEAHRQKSARVKGA